MPCLLILVIEVLLKFCLLSLLVFVTGRCSVPQRRSSLEEAWCGWCDYSQRALWNLGAIVVVSGQQYPLSFIGMSVFALCVLLNPTCSWKLVKSLMLVMCGLCLMDTEIIVSQCILVYLFLGEIDHWWYLGLFQAHGIDHLVIPTRDYLFAPSFVDINRAVQFIHRGCFLFNLISGKCGV